MVSLKAVSSFFQTELQRLDGLRFKGTIFPADEGAIPSHDILAPRLILRVDPASMIRTTDIIVDGFGRHFLLADHHQDENYRAHRLFYLTDQLVWKRSVKTVDDLTELEKDEGYQTIGTIWVVQEPGGREFTDRGMLVREEVKRVVTGYPLQLNDLLDDRVVKRIDRTLGVNIVETQ